jgi:ferredoxin
MSIDYASIQASLQAQAAELLASGQAAEVIGWEAGRFANQTTPAFIRKPEDATRLVYSPYCVNTLGKYALEESVLVRDAASGANNGQKIAVCVRGCDSRGINRMLADNQLEREDVFLIGLPCEGALDRATGERFVKCVACTHRNAVESDVFCGSQAPEPDAAPEERFAAVEKFAALPAAARRAYFEANYNKCIRCYACRQVCPVCTCKECFTDRDSVGWQGKQNNLPENRFYGLTRVFHIADRCVECGECERACPMDLPLMVLNRKMIQDLQQLFAMDEGGLAAEGRTTLASYDLGDREEFM